MFEPQKGSFRHNNAFKGHQNLTVTNTLSKTSLSLAITHNKNNLQSEGKNHLWGVGQWGGHVTWKCLLMDSIEAFSFRLEVASFYPF